MEISKLAINKKITAFFADGSQKMNLGIATVIGLLHGKERVPVDVAPLARASRLLTDLAESAGRIVEQAEEGVFLVQSAEPVVEPVAEVVAQSVAEAIAEPIEVIAQPEVTVTKASHKYATLGTIFFRGSIAGQIKSVFKTRETNPAKVVEYRQALANGDCTLGAEPLPQSLLDKLKVLGIEV
jgi:hypothetical protein